MVENLNWIDDQSSKKNERWTKENLKTCMPQHIGLSWCWHCSAKRISTIIHIHLKRSILNWKHNVIKILLFFFFFTFNGIVVVVCTLSSPCKCFSPCQFFVTCQFSHDDKNQNAQTKTSHNTSNDNSNGTCRNRFRTRNKKINCFSFGFFCFWQKTLPFHGLCCHVYIWRHSSRCFCLVVHHCARKRIGNWQRRWHNGCSGRHHWRYCGIVWQHHSRHQRAVDIKLRAARRALDKRIERIRLNKEKRFARERIHFQNDGCFDGQIFRSLVWRNAKVKENKNSKQPTHFISKFSSWILYKSNNQQLTICCWASQGIVGSQFDIDYFAHG